MPRSISGSTGAVLRTMGGGSRWALLLSAALLSACTCASDPPVASQRAGQTEGSRGAPSRCAIGSAQQTLHASSEASAGDATSDLFAIELGPAIVGEQGYWVPWLSGDGRKSTAGLTALKPDLSASSSATLGIVHWDAAPPRVVALANDAVLAIVPDADASGDSYRVARVQGNEVTWGSEIDGGRDEASGFDVAATADGALLVWDDFISERAMGAIVGASLDHEGHIRGGLRQFSPPASDAEAPRVAAHAGGYWLAWLSVSLQPAEEVTASHSEPMAMRATRRWIEVLRLDAAGQPQGEPITASSPDAMVQSFDLQAGHDGSALLSWREDFSNAGTSGGRVFVGRLTAGGDVERHAVDGEKFGGTLPTLLFDPRPPSGVPHAWLTLESAAGDSALAALSPMGRPLEVLGGGIGLGVASVLGALNGQLLLARPKGRDVVFLLARCGYQPAAPRPDGGA